MLMRSTVGSCSRQSWASGKLAMMLPSSIDDVIRNYHKNNYSTDSISKFMETKRALQVKMQYFQVMKSKGVEFLPKTESIDNFVAQHNRNDMYVLYYSETLRDDDEKWQNTYQVFLGLVEERNAHVGTSNGVAVALNTESDTSTGAVLLNSPQFLVVDVALHHPTKGLKSLVHIAQYSNGRVVTNDVVKDKCSAVTHNIITWSRIDKFGRSPQKFAVARLICPLAIQSKCNPKPREWVCHRCNDTMLYNLYGHFYCNCGGVLLQDCQFKCCDPQHGSDFSSFANLKTLKEHLPKVADSDFINILLLGQTGVEKSTFINALRNFLEYSTMEDAIQGGVKVLISSKLRQGDDTVMVGEEDPREACTQSDFVGKSSTQSCTSHYFPYRGKIFQIIDTPGIGDVRGFAQDKLNKDHILQYIEKEDQLHGICVLLKPNESRLSSEFEFCITAMLLTDLHRHAVNNIMFCYTHAQTTRYGHGDTHALVRGMISDIGKVYGTKIPYHVKENTFFSESDIFWFLVCLQHGIGELPTDEHERDSLFNSWDRGVQQTKNLLETILKLEPHVLTETLSLKLGEASEQNSSPSLMHLPYSTWKQPPWSQARTSVIRSAPLPRRKREASEKNLSQSLELRTLPLRDPDDSDDGDSRPSGSFGGVIDGVVNSVIKFWDYTSRQYRGYSNVIHRLSAKTNGDDSD